MSERGVSSHSGEIMEWDQSSSSSSSKPTSCFSYRTPPTEDGDDTNEQHEMLQIHFLIGYRRQKELLFCTSFFVSGLSGTSKTQRGVGNLIWRWKVKKWTRKIVRFASKGPKGWKLWKPHNAIHLSSHSPLQSVHINLTPSPSTKSHQMMRLRLLRPPVSLLPGTDRNGPRISTGPQVFIIYVALNIIFRSEVLVQFRIAVFFGPVLILQSLLPGISFSSRTHKEAHLWWTPNWFAFAKNPQIYEQNNYNFFIPFLFLHLHSVKL